MRLRLSGSTHYPYSRDTKPGVDRSHPCYRKGGPNMRLLWPASRGTYVRALHGEIGGGR